MTEAAKELTDRRLLGWGMACAPLYPGVDLAQDIALTGGDFQLVSGLDNLAQDLTLALTTALGADPFDTGFGFDGVNALAEETNPMLARERVRISVIKLLKRDPRVRRILDVKLLDGRLRDLAEDDSGDGSAEDARASLGRILNVRVVFEAITGEQSVVELGGAKLNA